MHYGTRHPKPSQPAYCAKCGKPLEGVTEDLGRYDMYTGERETRRLGRCPDAGALGPHSDSRFHSAVELEGPPSSPPPPRDFGTQVVMRGGLPKDLAARIDAIEGRAP